MYTIDEIIAINIKRIKATKRKYNPYTGEGSCIKRFRLKIGDGKYMLLPYSMKQIDYIKNLLQLENSIVNMDVAEYKDMIARLSIYRIEHDFEYWCATCVRIQDKLTKKSVPFILRRPQQKLFEALINSLHKQKPIRVIVLKARQWGGSTLVQLFMAWIQLFHRKSWHSVIVADVEDQARNIKSMYSRMAQYHPTEVFPVIFSAFEGSAKNKVIEGRDCIIYMGSMQKPDSLRSADVMMAHLSEVGLWKATEGKRPEDLVQSIAGSVPLEPYSVIVMESTAKGIGNFFHKEWQKAVAGTSGYTPVFVAWYEIEIYSTPFATAKDRRIFIESMSEIEKEYFRLGATLEAINWYRQKKYTDSYDDWRMGCEFPTTPTEAFQSTGRRAHPPSYVADMRKYVTEPLYKGDMYALMPYGVGAIDKTLQFHTQSQGVLHLWALPDKQVDIKRRYIVSMDIGGRNKDADWSVISIIDRYWLTEGGVEECIGTCRFHLDQDLAVWKAVQIATFFNNALLVVEANSLDSKGSEGDHTLTILDEIKGVYSNLYCRTDPQRIIEGVPERYGFFTSRASKSDLVNQMNKRLREKGYIERDVRALDEVDTYEIKDDGSYGAIDGGHDDIYMSRAIGLKASQTYEKPFVVREKIDKNIAL